MQIRKDFTLIVAFLMLLFTQCENPVSEKPVDDSAVLDEVKTWFEKGRIVDGNSTKTSLGFESTIHWNRAKAFQSKKDKNKFVISAPLEAYSEKQPQSKFHLIAFRSQEKIQGMIVQIIPNKDYLKQRYIGEQHSGFSGQVKIKLKNGKQMRTQQFESGVQIPFKNGGVSTFRTMEEDDYVWDLGELPEVEIIAYEDSYDTGFDWIWLDGSFMDTGDYDDFSYDDDFWMYDDYNDDGYVDVAIPVDDDGISCGSFNFVQTTSAWQEAAVTGIGFQVRQYNAATKTYTSSSMKITRAVWFGLPKVRYNGDEVSAGEAAEMAAEAVQYASDMTHLLYIQNPATAVTNGESIFMGYLQSKLLMDGGRADFRGSQSPNVIPNAASYNLFGNGDCD